MTVVLLVIIAVGVWAMAAESVIYALMKLAGWHRERAEAVKLARQIRAAAVTPSPDPDRLATQPHEEV